MRWLDHERKIAVTGLAGAGKTVFLLSLLQHIENFDPDRFRLGDAVDLTGFTEWPVPNGATPLPRAALRARLMEAHHAAWPDKTSDIYRYRCSFLYSQLGWPTRLWNKIRLHRQLRSRQVEWSFLDFPGERLADSLMMMQPSFEQWSDQLLTLLASYERLSTAMREFTDCTGSSPPATPEMVLATYKRGLSRMIHGKRQIITPSTFMLDGHGGVFSYRDVENGGKERICGLPGSEFTPLPQSYRMSRPGVAALFAENYRRYRAEVVEPLFASINGCDRLLVLIDIPGILSGGVGRLNDANHLIDTLAGAITPSSWLFTKVDKAAFIASKSDMVHRRDQDSLRALVEDMMRIARNRQPRLKYQSLVVSAWVSAHSVDLPDGGRALRGIPLHDEEERIFRVPELHPEWPADWDAEDPCYSYPLVAPPRLANRFLAPEQRNLEQVFQFILS